MTVTPERLREIADEIENNPEWFQSDAIDDAEIVAGLRLAAALTGGQLDTAR